ncbi:NERD domain-containing protein [Bacillus sp. Marseille-P3661]|uniref:NERD domain-containing protein n=1 Tax=Bacillus sp. Marseille-P3661 TaxID=1936234 RepID=UPI000C822E0D|nr:NERD domain-containing protein [Bacillus sp. Marseille-P3661]
MIKKHRKIPIKAVKLESLLRRLTFNYPNRQRIEDELAMSLAGYRGQQSLDYYISFLDEQKYLILHDVRLHFKDNYYFQMDTVIVCSSFIVIAEVKNMLGELYYDYAHHQLVRTLNEKVEGFEDPVLQVDRQRLQFKYWLQKNKLPFIPIEPLVVNSNSSAILKIDPQYQKFLQHVIRIPKFPFKIESIANTHKKECMNATDLKKITRLLISQHVPEDPNMIKKFNINRSEILMGVQCPTCNKLPLQRQRGTWYCSSCKKGYKNAHLQAIKDYSMLIDDKINNEKLRSILHLSSKSVASKMLVSLKFKQSGGRKNRTYILPKPHEWDETK